MIRDKLKHSNEKACNKYVLFLTESKFKIL